MQETGPSLHKEAVADGKNLARLMVNVMASQECLSSSPSLPTALSLAPHQDPSASPSVSDIQSCRVFGKSCLGYLHSNAPWWLLVGHNLTRTLHCSMHKSPHHVNTPFVASQWVSVAPKSPPKASPARPGPLQLALANLTRESGLPGT